MAGRLSGRESGAVAQMRLVVQRVSRAEVRSGGARLGRIDRGALVLVGIAAGDRPAIVDRMADKLARLRYFEDPGGRTNCSIVEAGGALLVVSQFTLLADLRRGRRPGFSDAAPPEEAAPLLDRFVERLVTHRIPVQTGRFGAAMEVELVNDGPFTLLLDSAVDLPAS